MPLARWLMLAACLALAGCAGLPTQSFVSPDAHGQAYDGFLAYAAFSDLGAEGAFEKAMCHRLHDAGHACTTMLQAAPPTAAQNGDSRHRAALKSGAQAVITIELANPKADSRRILAAGRPGYRITLVDTSNQKVVARMTVEGHRNGESPKARARTLSAAVLQALQQRHLLARRQ